MISIEDGQTDLELAISLAMDERGDVCEIQKETCTGNMHKYIQKTLFVLQNVYPSTVERRINSSDIVLCCMNCFVWVLKNQDSAISEGIIIR